MCMSAITDSCNRLSADRPTPVPEGLTRRRFFKLSATAAAGAAVVAAGGAVPALAAQAPGRRVVDLTHRLFVDFPGFLGGGPSISVETIFDFDTAGFLAKEWTFYEHIGTHIDPPGHFLEGMASVDQLDVAALVAPIVVIDLTAKAIADPNATVELSDVRDWERRHGRIPEGALVCMRSGWDAKVNDGDAFRGGTGFPDLAFPGFGAEAADFLATRRRAVGLGVDTLSIDPGDSATFPVHFGFLATGGYGIECLANLASIPERGATAFVGAVPFEGAAGGPCRVIATW
jgi:kynurenine formamidase